MTVEQGVNVVVMIMVLLLLIGVVGSMYDENPIDDGDGREAS